MEPAHLRGGDEHNRKFQRKPATPVRATKLKKYFRYIWIIHFLYKYRYVKQIKI